MSRANPTIQGGAGSPASEAAAALAASVVARVGPLLQDGARWAGRASGRIRDAVRGGLLRQALAARERGNLAAAFWLLEEDIRSRPDDAPLAALFWDVAVEFGRPEDAAPAVAGLIRRHSTAGVELAAQYWCELLQRVPDALADPAALIRIVPVLQEGESAAADEATRRERRRLLRKTLRAVVDPRNGGLSAGLALHTAEIARELDPPTALVAARLALQSGDLHEAKRTKLVELVAKLTERTGAAAVPAEAPQDTSSK